MRDRPRPAEWRFGRGWSAVEISERLDQLALHRITSAEPLARGAHYYSEALVAREAPGAPEPKGCFQRARKLVEDYAFSDPRIVRGHFDHRAPLAGRRMLLEIQVWGLRYLGGVVVAGVVDRNDDRQSSWGYRYDTLEGHIESGAEWFLLTKDHASGDVRFRIEARWLRGQLPTWWSRAGFSVLGRRYQRAWHRLAYLRLRRRLGAASLPNVARGTALVRPATGMFPQPSITSVTGPEAPRTIGMEEVTVE